MKVGEFKRLFPLFNAENFTDSYADEDLLTRKICAVILHGYLQRTLKEKDEIDISPAMVLKDIYDCRICANHIAQVYVKGIMEEGKRVADIVLFDLDKNVSGEEAEGYINLAITPSLRNRKLPESKE